MGRGFVHRLADLGADIAVLVIDLQAGPRFGEKLEAESVAAEVRSRGARGIEFSVDLTDTAAVGAVFAAMEAKLGRIDILVNTAGRLLYQGSAATLGTGEMKATIDLNLVATVACCQQAVRAMRNVGGGVIVNVSSSRISMRPWTPCSGSSMVRRFLSCPRIAR
jgi:NAD(P)-dependent dehydrogenase (short-subunit alcohol dehydrogenase family)